MLYAEFIIHLQDRAPLPVDLATSTLCDLSKDILEPMPSDSKLLTLRAIALNRKVIYIL